MASDRVTIKKKTPGVAQEKHHERDFLFRLREIGRSAPKGLYKESKEAAAQK